MAFTIQILAFTIQKGIPLGHSIFLYYEKGFGFFYSNFDFLYSHHMSWLGHSIFILKVFGFERRISHRHGLGFTYTAPKSRLYQQKFFFGFYYSRILAFTIRPFWLLLFKFWLLLFKTVYYIFQILFSVP